MATVADSFSPKFILNTGDNFYWCGVQNTSDFQIEEDWIKPYSALSLQIPWYSILGVSFMFFTSVVDLYLLQNHEYGYNVQAQIDLSGIYKNWVMDDRYYTKRILVDEKTETYLSIIFLDTSPCISGYRSDNPSKWSKLMAL